VSRRPVIFLDIDDVLAINEHFTGVHVAEAFRTDELDQQEMWEQLMLPEAVANLRALHEEFWPQYVISSSWATFFDREQMREIFNRTHLEFVAKNLHKSWTTPKGLGPSRLWEIETWLRLHRRAKHSVLVLDDYESGRALQSSPLDEKHCIILCDVRCGFTTDKLALARTILNAQTT